MSNTDNPLKILEALRSERDADLEGTFPRSSPIQAEALDDSNDVSTTDSVAHDSVLQGGAHSGQRHRPNTTTRQWRDYSHTELAPPDLPQATTPDRYAAQLVLASVRRSSDILPSGPRPGTLLDENGRAVVGSRAIPPEERERIASVKPGYSVAK